MSTTIDQRVVEMKFDNKNFEQNVSTTMSSLDKLKQKLNLSGASKGLEEINSAAKNNNLSALGTAAETISAKFSAMQVVGITALSNITNSAVNAGKRMISALTIDPIKSGFTEYETKINAIQTIMSNTASKGTTMEDVTRVIGELNTYADKTIYNFAEMTRNIGTFTAAGVGLEDSASAIQGIANLAAASGSTSQQASTAMYQLSQALASGTVKLMDWNSVVNAGMGGEKFQEALKATAREHGVAVDAMIKENGSFRESLQEGWLSADILNETLRKFTVEGATEYAESMVKSGKYTQEQADALIKEAQAMEDAATKVKTFTQLWDTLKESAQSGWSQTWEILIGDFEEAKETLTGISEVIGGVIESSAKARNELLQGWKDEGGRAHLIDSLYNIIDAIGSVVTPIKEAFRDIFPPTTVQQLLSFTEGIKNFTAKLKLSDTASENLKRTFKGLFAIFDIGKQFIGGIITAIKPLFGGLDDLGGGILGVTARIGDWLVKLNETIKTTNIFGKAGEKVAGFFKGVKEFVAIAAEAISDFYAKIKEKIDFSGFEKFQGFIDRIKQRFDQAKAAAGDMQSGVSIAFAALGNILKESDFLSTLKALWDGISKIGAGIGKFVKTLTGGFIEKLGNADFSGVFDFINTLSVSGIAVFVAKFVKGFSDITESVGSFKDSALDILNEVKGCFEAYQTQLKAGALMKIASAIAILAAAIVVISLIDSEKLSASLGAITVLFADLMASMAIFGKISGEVTGVFKTCSAMISISIAVLILASALKKIASLKWDELAKGLIGVIGLTATMVGAMSILSNSTEKVTKGALRMVLFAAAIKILASVCRDLSDLSWTQLAKGLIGVGALLAAVSIFLNTAKLSGKAIGTATGIVILAAAFKILALVCEDFGEMDWGTIGKGLVAIGALLLELAIFTRLTGNAKHVISTGIALAAISAALLILYTALNKMGSMSWESIGKGLTTLAASMLILAVALNLMKGTLFGSAALLVATTALAVLTPVLLVLGSMRWESIAKGLVTLAGSMLILAVALNFMKGTLGGSLALLVAAAALAVLTPVLLVLGSMSWESIIKGLVSIAGALAIIGIAGVVLGPVIPSILALAGALVLVGVAAIAIGAGLALAGVGISLLAVSLGAFGTALAASATAIVAGLSVIVLGIAELIPAVAVKIGEGIIAICQVIAEGAPVVGEAIKALVLTFVDVMVECIPALAEGALKLLIGVMDALVTYAPQLIDLLFQFLLLVIEGVTEHLPELIKAAVDLLMAFFSGVVDAISGIDVDTLIKGLAGIGLMSGIMFALSAVGSLVPGAMVGVLGVGAVIAELALVIAAIGALAQIPGFEWLIGEGGDFLELVGLAIGKFVGGIAGGIMSGISSQLPQIGTDLSAFMTNVQPFVEGVKSVDASALEGVGVLTATILALTVADLVNGIVNFLSGGNSFASLGTELSNFIVNAQPFIEGIKTVDPAAMEAAKSLASMLLIITAADLLDSITSWITGSSSLTSFGEQLIPFGEAMVAFSNTVSGNIDEGAVTAAANAGSVIASMAETLPNSGGVVGFFTGENDLDTFAAMIVPFGEAMVSFSDTVSGKIDEGAVTAAANAGKTLIAMADTIPNSGGVVGFFTGENDLDTFAAKITPFGEAIAKFSAAVSGKIDEGGITAAANAGKTLIAMADTVPNSGGVVAFFTGDNTLDTFGSELESFGTAMANFSAAVSGKIDENAVTAAANAGSLMASLQGSLENTGGVVAFFTGDNTLDTFGESLVPFGKAIADFSATVSGKIDEGAVTAAANAGMVMAELQKALPEEGGWFSNVTTLEDFGKTLTTFGGYLYDFYLEICLIDTMKLTNAASGAQEFVNLIKQVSGIDISGVETLKSAFDKFAEMKLAEFKDKFSEGATAAVNRVRQLAEDLAGLKDYADKTGVETLRSALNIVTALNITKFKEQFAEGLSTYVGRMKSLATGISNLSEQAIDTTGANNLKSAVSTVSQTPVQAMITTFSGSVSDAIGNMKKLVSGVNGLVDLDSSGVSKFVDSISKLGTTGVEAFIKAFSVDSESVRSAGSKMVESVISGIESKRSSLKTTASETVTTITKAFDDNVSKFKPTGSKMMTELISGLESKKSGVKTAVTSSISSAVTAIRGYYSNFNSAGSYLVSGFASGISANSYKAAAQARAMAKAAVQAAEEALGIASPSKVFGEIGNFAGLGFVNKLRDYADKSYDAGSEMANSARSGLQDAINKVLGIMNGTMDVQPTIRPVLDLSGVESGVGVLNGMLSTDMGIGVTSNLRAINATFGQNGGNDDVIRAIGKLGDKLDNVGGTTNVFEGITYGGADEEINDAVSTLVRAARVERRR